MKLPEKWQDWEITDHLGSGSYGSVYQIENEDEIKAVKIIEIPQEDEYPLIMKEHGQDAEAYCRSIAQDFETEIQTLSLLSDCENIITIEDYIVEKKGIGWVIYIFMDCLYSFSEYAASHEFKENDIIRFATEITKALMACEKEGVIHRDIKPENVLVTEEGHFLLCDFGLARKLNYKQQTNSVKGTYKYMAPEVYHGEKYSGNVDIYSLGLILYQYMNKRRGVFLPLDKDVIFFKDQEEALAKRMEEQVIPAPVEASEEFADIILKMIAYDPKERYQSAEKLLKDLILLQNGKYRIKRSFSVRRYRKQLIAVGLAALCLGGFFMWSYYPVFRQESCGDETYATLTNNGTLTISGSGEVSEVDPWGDYTQKIKKIVIKEGITEIDPDGNGIFSDCPNLKSVFLPESLDTIGDNVFSNDKTLSKVKMLNTDISIGSDTFYDTLWEKNHTDENGFLIFNQTLMAYSGNISDVIIPEGVWRICGGVFLGKEEIKSLKLPESLEWIGMETFKDCENLEKIDYGKNIIEIGPNAFEGTKWQNDQEWAVMNGILVKYNGKDEEITIPSNIPIVGNYAFDSNTFIKKVMIPKHVKSIGQGAFLECDHLESINIEAPITDVEYVTFYHCTSLKTVHLPDTLKTIQSQAFDGCVRLKHIRIPKDTELVSEFAGIETGAPFHGCKINIERY